VGDNIYDLSYWDGSLYNPLGSIIGGVQYDFLSNVGPAGVSKFKVEGIETTANLDPNNNTAFITGLTFTNGGALSVTQTPIQVNVSEPSVVILMLSGLLGWRANSRLKLIKK
jgi:hypothetical protein